MKIAAKAISKIMEASIINNGENEKRNEIMAASAKISMAAASEMISAISRSAKWRKHQYCLEAKAKRQ
jgi:hypothetical protein